MFVSQSKREGKLMSCFLLRLAAGVVVAAFAAIATVGTVSIARAETLYLTCVPSRGGSPMNVAIDLDRRSVAVLADYGLRWHSDDVDISENKIVWRTIFKTQSRSGTDSWMLDRYAGTLITDHPGSSGTTSLYYRCEKSEKLRPKF
jgi:hypothetical protein